MGATEFLVSKHRALDLQNDDDGREIKGTVHSSCEQIFFQNFFTSTITFIAVRSVAFNLKKKKYFLLFAMHSPFMEAVTNKKHFINSNIILGNGKLKIGPRNFLQMKISRDRDWSLSTLLVIYEP